MSLVGHFDEEYQNELVNILNHKQKRTHIQSDLEKCISLFLSLFIVNNFNFRKKDKKKKIAVYRPLHVVHDYVNHNLIYSKNNK